MQNLLVSTLAVGTTNATFLIAIALLACILGAEIAGICILISKMLRARRERHHHEETDAVEEQNSSYHYSVGIVALFGAIPQGTYNALILLSALAAVGAVVFVVLLIVCRAKGYDFASSAWYAVSQSRREMPQSAPVLDDEKSEDAAKPEPFYPDGEEEQWQDAYTEGNQWQNEETPLSAFDETEENNYSEETEDSVPEVVEGELIPSPAHAEPTPQGATVAQIQREPVFADGTQPYKVVEKVVTEKVTEIYKETPTESKGTANDQVLEKLVDLLDYEIRSRREKDTTDSEMSKAQEADDDKKNGSVATFAESDLDDDDEDDDDELDEAAEGSTEDDEDRDDEENDTDGDHFTGNERIIGFDEETGCYIVAHYRKSFEAKLIQARPNIKKYYSDIKNALLSYKGTKNRISWTADSFHNGRTPIAKINVKTRILELYLAIDPASLEGTVYRGQDVGSKKKYADTPFRYKLRTPRKLKWALELIQRTCEEHGLSPIDIEHINYEEQYPFDTTENLVERKLIKEYIRQEKPATTFELDPDHIPDVPDEDESVIPANANFSWEFDNERMEAQEIAEEPIEEPAPEPEPVSEPEPEPVSEPEPAPAPQASIVRETVKVTEMRYTERYYADAQPTYEQVITTTESIEALPEPTVEDVTVVEDPIVTENTFVSSDDVADDETSTNTETAEAAEEEADTDEIFFGDETVRNANGDEVVIEDASFQPSFYAESTYESADGDAETEDEPAEAVFEEVEVEEIETEEVVKKETEEEPRRNVNPTVAVVDICSLEEHYDAGDVIDLASLKEKSLILPTALVLKVYASGTLSKSFTVEANHFTLDAIKAISDADGDSVMVR